MGAIEHIVIVGAALAGAIAAKTLRKEGYDGRLRLNVWDVNDEIKALVASRVQVRADELRDSDVPLAEMARVA